MARQAAEQGITPDVESLENEHIQNLLYEFGVYQTEILAQNEELNNLRSELEAARDRFAALYEHAPVGYLTLRPDGTVLQSNLAFCEILGEYRSRVLDSNLYPRLKDIHQRLLGTALQKAADTGEPQVFEAILRTPENGRETWAQFNIRMLTEEFGSGSLLLATVTDISRLKAYESELQSALNQKDSLLNEIHHRVKNNLQVILGLLDLSALRCGGAESEELVKDVRGKIHSMALVHNMLHRQQSIERIGLLDFSEQLFKHLVRIHAVEGFELSLQGTDARLELGKAIPTGLILNELFVNAMKYAYKGGARKLSCKIEESPDSIIIEVADDGPGLPNDVNPMTTKTLGLRLVRDLTRLQLGGSFSIQQDSGFKAILAFPA
jgi:PAS domain S-box-containing protein